MKIDRLVSIIMILLEKERIGAHELAVMFEVSPRTIYRDIDTINMAGIPVLSIPGVGGGFEIMRQYKIDKKVFSTADLSAILMGLSNMSNIVRGEELVNTLAKVRSFIPADKENDIELETNQIYIDLSPWMRTRNVQPYLEYIKEALRDKKLISFEYADGHGNKTEREAEPHQLVLKNSDWYFYGYCLMREDFRLFKISRMSKLFILEESFTPRDFKKPQLYYDDNASDMQIQIKLRIHKSAVERVFDFCSYDDLSPDGSEHFFVSFPFIENDFYYNILLGFGDKCECLAPPHIRDEIKRRIYEIAAIYES